MYFYSDIFSSLSQEVILKRAADLVEALYGLPHNNQVRITHKQKREKERVVSRVFWW